MSGLEPQPSRQLYLNSRNASYIVDTVKNSRLTFSLNEPIICPKGHELYASIVSCEIPNTLYTVDANTTFVFNWYKAGAFVSATTFTCATKCLFEMPFWLFLLEIIREQQQLQL